MGSSLLPSTSFSSKYCSKSRDKNVVIKKVSTIKVFASIRDANDRQNFHSGGRLVDENMIVLRKRIHEMKMVERNYEPPADWMKWEKRYYTRYDSILCEAMGVVQSQLMNTRPSLALGMMALIILSVPTSTAVLCYHLIEITKGILTVGFHSV